MTFGSLFAGIGGMDLGLERADMRCVWQVEIDPFCRRVLEKHWPDTRRHDDIRTFPPGDPEPWRCDLIAGGFPCQDISFAGKGAGLAGERSGLWYEFARVIRELRPRYVLVENVAALLVRGMGDVLGTLAALGFDAEWDCIPAAATGAPHLRDRIFIVAHSSEDGDQELRFTPQRAHPTGKEKPFGSHVIYPTRGEGSLPNSYSQRLEIGSLFGIDSRTQLAAFERANRSLGGCWGLDPAESPESRLGRLADGIPSRVERLAGLGNAVVPQVAEWIGRRIMEATEGKEALDG